MKSDASKFSADSTLVQQNAQDIWSKLSFKVAAKPSTLEAVKDEIEHMKDFDYQNFWQV